MLSLVDISSVVLEKKIFEFINVFSLFRNYLPLEKGGALHLNKLEFPSPKDALCHFKSLSMLTIEYMHMYS